MKILIVGSAKHWAIENYYAKYLIELGHEVDRFNAHDIFYDYYYKSIFNKLYSRFGVSGIYKNINASLLNVIKTETYDILWIFKGMEIFPNTIHKISKQGIKIVNYNPDHPFIHNFRGSGNTNVIKSIGLYDVHFCYSLSVLKRIEQEYNIPCAWLPFGYETGQLNLPKPNEEILRSCFIGNPDPNRANLIRKLSNAGLPIDVYGNFWKKYLKSSSYIRIYPAIYKTDFTNIATKYRLQLNIFRPHNENSHNMRTFEMPALGAIVLSPDSREHKLLFVPNEEMFLYKDNTEAIRIAKYILSLSFKDALKHRIAAYNRTVESNYSYEGRAKQVAKYFIQIIEGSFSSYNYE